MTANLRELDFLSTLLALQSPLPVSRASLHGAAAWEILYLIAGFFLTIHASHIPCHFHCVSYTTPTFFLFDFSSIFITNFGAQLYSILSPYWYIKIVIISNTSLMGGMVAVIPSSRRGNPSSIPRSSQHMTQSFHFLTTSLASIFGSAVST